MKKIKLLNTLCAIILAVTYVLSLAGFDVHHCNRTGKTYLVLLSRSRSCEQIHPGHYGHNVCNCGECSESHCNCGECSESHCSCGQCSESHCNCGKCSDDCCNDESFVIQASVDCPKIQHQEFNNNLISKILCHRFFEELPMVEALSAKAAESYIPHIGLMHGRETLSINCVLRV